MILERLKKQNLINPPEWLITNINLLTIMGSNAYGTAMDSSDLDIYGFCMPPLRYLFPNAYGGEIEGFGKQKPRFNQWQQHHIKTDKVEYDFTIYSISKYFDLAMDANPNIIDSLFVPENCVIQNSEIGQLVRDNRKLFLTKKVHHTFRGYAYQQKHKMLTKDHSANEKRQDDIQAVGYSTKYMGHLVRLLLASEQILNTGDYDIQRDREVIKSIRRREWTLDKGLQFFEDKLVHLEDAYNNSTLPHSPDEDAIRKLLMDCIELHYGTISKAITIESSLLDDIEEVLRKYRK